MAQKQIATPSKWRPSRIGLGPLLFNIYIHDLTALIAKKFAYADDLAIMHSAENWQMLERVLTQDMATLSNYLQKWKLKLV